MWVVMNGIVKEWVVLSILYEEMITSELRKVGGSVEAGLKNPRNLVIYN